MAKKPFFGILAKKSMYSKAVFQPFWVDPTFEPFLQSVVNTLGDNFIILT